MDDEPTEKMKLKMIEKIENTLEVPFEIEDHVAAIRPTIYDRRPLLGAHPDHPQVTIFNGLGTKGASLAPFWANHFSDYLLNNITLHPEVDIFRHEKLIKT